MKKKYMTKEEMKDFIEEYESGEPLKDFYDYSQLEEWLYQFCLKHILTGSGD